MGNGWKKLLQYILFLVTLPILLVWWMMCSTGIIPVADAEKQIPDSSGHQPEDSEM